jgi:hypothetical protein
MLTKTLGVTVLFLTAMLTVTTISMKQTAQAADDISFKQTQTNAPICTSSGSTCTNSATIIATITSPPDNNFVHSTQDQLNVCTASSTCDNIATHKISVSGTDNKLSQDTKQNNDCNSSQCSNQGTTTASVTGNNNVDQKTTQKNLCLTSTCKNQADLGTSGVVTQDNKCYLNANCENTSTGGSNSQSNFCIGSSCKNSGTNNDNTCSNGSTCNNSGTNSKMTSNSATCATSSSHVHVICTPGRTVIVPN